MWGSEGEAPSFINAMPLGGKRVVLEETCLVAKPAMPFAVLKRRLERRLKAVGIKVIKVSSVEQSVWINLIICLFPVLDGMLTHRPCSGP